MTHNTATWDRIVRLLAGAAMLVGSLFAPFPLLVRVLALAVGGIYMLATALSGTCLGYRLIGFSTCPVAAGKPR